MTDEYRISVESPESPITTTGTDHVTMIGSNIEDTIEYYRDLLGMPLVLKQPNLDDPNSTHLFFDTGDGRIITFFVSEDRPTDSRPLQHQIGSVHHLAFSIAPEAFVDTRDALEAAGYGYNEFDRGIFHSLYTRDPNGLTIELSTDKYDVPDDRRGEVLATAQRLREEDGADYAKDEHLAAALEELGLDAEPYDLPDAPTGAGV